MTTSLSGNTHPNSQWNSMKNCDQNEKMYQSIEDHIRKNQNSHQEQMLWRDQRNETYKSIRENDEDKNQSKTKNTDLLSTTTITQRDIINLLDRCPQLMRQDKIFLRNRVKAYFKELTLMGLNSKGFVYNAGQRLTYQQLISPDHDISELIQILGQCKKPLDKIYLYEKHMHWLQIKIRKYIAMLHKKKKQECLDRFKKTKRLESNDQNLMSPVPMSTKNMNKQCPSSGFYRRFKNSNQTNHKNDKSYNVNSKLRTCSNLSSQLSKRRKNQKSQQNHRLITAIDERKNRKQKNNSQTSDSKHRFLKHNLRGNKVQSSLQHHNSHSNLRRSKQQSTQRRINQLYPQTCKADYNKKGVSSIWNSTLKNSIQSFRNSVCQQSINSNNIKQQNISNKNTNKGNKNTSVYNNNNSNKKQNYGQNCNTQTISPNREYRQNQLQYTKTDRTSNIKNIIDLDDLSQINKKSTINNDYDNNQDEDFGTQREQFGRNCCTQQNSLERKSANTFSNNNKYQYHLKSVIQKQPCEEVSEWQKKLTSTNPFQQRQYKIQSILSSQKKKYLVQQNKQEQFKEISDKINNIKLANQKIDALLESSKKLVENIEETASPSCQKYTNNINSYPRTDENYRIYSNNKKQQNLFTSPEILQQCRRFLNNASKFTNSPQCDDTKRISSPEKYGRIHQFVDHTSQLNPQQDQTSPQFGWHQKLSSQSDFTMNPYVNNISHKNSRHNSHYNSQEIANKFTNFRELACQIFKNGDVKILTQEQTEQILTNIPGNMREQIQTILRQKSGKISFENMLPLILSTQKQQGTFVCKSIFQLLDLDCKGHIDSEDFEVFLQNFRNSEVSTDVFEDISDALSGVKKVLMKNLQFIEEQKIYLNNFYYLEIVQSEIMSKLCEVLQPFEFQINSPEQEQ